MTLSHCWGKNGVPIRLLEENYDTFVKGIEMSQLPTTFRDAIEVTRKMNIPFIWIDSLCIIQNSPGDKDWIKESAKMQHIYRNSFLNLAAGASPDSSGGLFRRRDPLSLVPWSISIGENGHLTRSYESEYTNSRNKTKLVLYTRGWVLQEQLLAPRTLIFGQEQLHWECSTGQGSELFPDIVERPPNTWRIFRPFWENILQGKVVDSQRQEAWNTLIATYFEMSLTKPSDRLVAISGLAGQLSNRWDGVTYLAGLWSYRLISELLWACRPDPCNQRYTEIAPSWSWASLVQEPQRQERSRLDTSPDRHTLLSDVLAEVLEARVTPRTSTSPFGPVTCGGSIKLRSPVLRARLIVDPENSEHKWYNPVFDDGWCRRELKIAVSWDEINDASDDVKDVYLAPIEVTEADDWDAMDLTGLVLRSVATSSLLHQTQFRRAGHFRLIGDLVTSDDSYCDDESDSGRDDDFGEPFQDGLVNNDGDGSREDHGRSSRKDPFQFDKTLEMLENEGIFRNYDAWFEEKIGDEPEERMEYLKKDPYVNGPPLNTTLKGRYPLKYRWIFPKIGRFLRTIAEVAENNKANGSPDPVLGLGEGNGYYTYEIV